LDVFQGEIRQMKSELETVSRERVEVEQSKNRLENQLRANLIRRRDKLEAQLKDRTVEDKRYRLESEQEQLKHLNDRLKKIIDRNGG
jgi:chromosome segregation ATPase